MTNFRVVDPVSPDMRFGDVRVGHFFRRPGLHSVWIKLSAVYAQPIDDPDLRVKVTDENQIVKRVVLDREES